MILFIRVTQYSENMKAKTMWVSDFHITSSKMEVPNDI